MTGSRGWKKRDGLRTKARRLKELRNARDFDEQVAVMEDRRLLCDDCLACARDGCTFHEEVE